MFITILILLVAKTIMNMKCSRMYIFCIVDVIYSINKGVFRTKEFSLQVTFVFITLTDLEASKHFQVHHNAGYKNNHYCHQNADSETVAF